MRAMEFTWWSTELENLANRKLMSGKRLIYFLYPKPGISTK
jgi:hypothetical protein